MLRERKLDEAVRNGTAWGATLIGLNDTRMQLMLAREAHQKRLG